MTDEDFSCPNCGGTKFWRIKRGNLDRCASCRKEYSFKSRRVFSYMKLTPATWFRMVELEGHRISVLQISKRLGINYRTAFSRVALIRYLHECPFHVTDEL